MLLVIDNYDSFTYNLVQYFGELGEDVQVYRNDKITLAQIEDLHPSRLVISPGPCTPREAGISVEAIRHLEGSCPFSVSVWDISRWQLRTAERSSVLRLMHGKTSQITHDGKTIFHSLPNPFEATRYHSLIVNRANLPDCCAISAETAEGEIMGLRHKTLGVEGVQFHPESILTTAGKDLLRNFLKL